MAEEGKGVPRHVLLGKGNGVFGHNRLPCRRVSRHEDRVVPFQVQDGLFLEHIGLKRPLWGRELDEG